MSRFLSETHAKLTPYVPGEQPRDMQYIKLNTNESPFPPSETAIKNMAECASKLNLYSDPTCKALTEAVASLYNVKPSNVIMTNGSDEILNFAFMAFCDTAHGAAFADITYGFYPVFAALYNIPAEIIPLREDFSLDVDKFKGIGKTIFIANPNAPTGLYLDNNVIEDILKANPDNIVVIDEAYIDFGGETCIPLIDKYDNLLVTQTFSKSRSLAGGRLGFGIASEAVIRDLNTMRNSTNPYNVNSMTIAAGLGALADDAYTRRNCKTIIENREYLTEKLKMLGFTVIDSKTNFVFAKSDKIDGESLYLKLKEKGVLVRHFSKQRIKDYNRITIGTREQCDILLAKISEILES